MGTDLPEPVWSASAGKYLCPLPGCPYKHALYYECLNHVRMHFDCHSSAGQRIEEAKEAK